ncbi:MAG TPA: SAM-dependent chlorinase/fluorinase [Nitrospiria bacterium]|nr:SAM-dependent chlorinase/fluorinase [Nitrospiria bacterium]
MIITLLTDFGDRDALVAQMKGVILSLQPRAAIVDITHEIPPFGIREAAFVLRSAARFFPEGTIHVVVVDPGVGGPRRPLLVVNRRGLFLAPDNGVLSYIYHDHPASRIYRLEAEKYRLKAYSATFDGRDLFAPVASRLSGGLSPSKLGKKIADPVSFPVPEVRRRSGGSLKGAVIHVDRFGNLITNITRKDLAPWLSDGKTAMVTIGGKTIDGLKLFYSEAAPGELAAVVNSDELLEIFCNQKDARSLLNAAPDEPVVVS